MAFPTQGDNAVVQTKTKTKLSLKMGVATLLLIIVAATVFGGFGTVASYSAVIGSDIFKVAAGKKGGGGGGGSTKSSLQVSLSNEVTNQSVVAGTKNHTFTKIVLNGSTLTKDVQVNEINFNISTDIQTNPAEVSNLKLYYSGTSTSTPTINDPDADTSAKTTGGDSAVAKFIFIDPVVISAGATEILELKGDISSAAFDGIYQVGIKKPPKGSKIKVVDATTVEGRKISTSYQYSDGPEMTFVAGGSLFISEDASALPNRLILAGTTDERLTSVRLKAINEDIRIERLTVGVVNDSTNGTAFGDYSDISKVHLKINGATLGNLNGYSIDNHTRQINLPPGEFIVPEGSSGVRLDILGEIAAVGSPIDNLPGTSNAAINVGLGGPRGFTATGEGSNFSATINYSNSTGSMMVLHKAVPTVTIETPSNSLSPVSVLTRVKITASGGPIGVYGLTFGSTYSSGVALSNIYSRLEACSGGCGGISPGSILSDTVVAPTDLGGDAVLYQLPVSSSQSHGKRYLAISEGSTATIDIFATVSTTPGFDSISTSLLGDARFYPANDTNGEPATSVAQVQGNFVWSDLLVDDSQSSTSLTASQWFNGYLVNGLGSVSTTTPVTIGE